MEKIVIKCPDALLDKNDRITQLLTNCKEWIYSEPILTLIHLFNRDSDFSGYGNNYEKDIVKLHEFAQIWDFRKGQERWAINDNSFVESNAHVILDAAYMLDLRDHIKPCQEADYIIPLGGARRANYVRPLMAKTVVDSNGWHNKTIVALSGTRPINDIEKPYMKDYAQTAATEYEAICSGLEKAFGVRHFNEEKKETGNINLQSAIRRYEKDNNNNNLYCIAAPSTEPKIRRANSWDTFKFFLDLFDIKEGSRLLLVTSCIYVPFQLLKFMSLALENWFEVDCIGADPLDEYALSKTSNYLQEIKGTIDTIFEITKRYSWII